MLPAFWDGLAGKLAEQFTAHILAPAFVFWAGGLITWTFGGGPWRGTDGRGWDVILSGAETLQRQPTVFQAALIIAVLLLLSGSAMIGEQLTLPLLRVLEGYRWPHFLACRLKERVRQKRNRCYERWSHLLTKQGQVALTDMETAELDLIDEQLRHMPATPELTMPTRLGNVLRVSETRPRVKYGLGTAVWPTLWPLLDRDFREELTQARAALNTGTRFWLWGGLFAIWTIWAWWALPISILACVATYYGVMLRAAQTYGDLVEAAFDIYRTRLYQAMRWPLPANPDEEDQEGQKLTQYLSRGLAPTAFKFDITAS